MFGKSDSVLEKLRQMAEIQKELDKIGYSETLSIVDGEIYFRWDTEDSDPKEQWDNYVEVSEDLRGIGYRLEDPYTEHDCITGNLIKEEI